MDKRASEFEFWVHPIDLLKLLGRRDSAHNRRVLIGNTGFLKIGNVRSLLRGRSLIYCLNDVVNALFPRATEDMRNYILYDYIARYEINVFVIPMDEYQEIK